MEGCLGIGMGGFCHTMQLPSCLWQYLNELLLHLHGRALDSWSLGALYQVHAHASAEAYLSLALPHCSAVVLAQGVAEGRLTVGDAVLFITLMQQLYAPLNYFGSYCAP